jgi:hypothetical protein
VLGNSTVFGKVNVVGVFPLWNSNIYSDKYPFSPAPRVKVKVETSPHVWYTFGVNVNVVSLVPWLTIGILLLFASLILLYLLLISINAEAVTFSSSIIVSYILSNSSFIF